MQVYNPPMALQIKQKILTPANETLQEGCLPASQSHLVPPSPGITLLQPSSGADQAPAHSKAVIKTLPSTGPLFPTLPLATFELFRRSPSPSLHAESGSPVFLTWHAAHVMFHVFCQWVHLTSVFLTRREAPCWQT